MYCTLGVKQVHVIKVILYTVYIIILCILIVLIDRTLFLENNVSY